MALLNLHDAPWAGEPGALPPKSRGVIIPRLILEGDVESAVALGRRELRPADYQPFRLVATDGARIAVFASDGNALKVAVEDLGNQARLFTSSGLGDTVVDAPRRGLFNAMLESGDPALFPQDAFHRHSWPDRRDVSVCMERPEARTVSYTTVDVSTAKVVLRYLADSPDKDPPPVELILPRNAR